MLLSRVDRDRGLLGSMKDVVRAAAVVSSLLCLSAPLSFSQTNQEVAKENKSAFVCGSSTLYVLPPEILADCVHLSMVDRNIVLRAYNNRYALTCGARIYGENDLEERRRYIESEPSRISRAVLQEIRRNASEMKDGISNYYDFNKGRIEDDADECSSNIYSFPEKLLLYTGIATAVLVIVAFVKNRI